MKSDTVILAVVALAGIGVAGFGLYLATRPVAPPPPKSALERIAGGADAVLSLVGVKL